MDSKEIKSALKAAKESLDQKDYKAAIKQCKAILKTERNNYLALVFYGAATQETEQKDETPKAFKKAIEISPNHLLAWRGLASFYERNESTCEQKDLLKVYQQLLILENDLAKLPEIAKKFEKEAITLGETSSVLSIFDSLESFDQQKKVLVQQCLVSVLESNLNLSEELIVKYQALLEDLMSTKPNVKNHLDISKKYLKLLYRQHKYREIITKAIEVIELYPDDVNLLEWICKAYIEVPKEILQELNEFSPERFYLKLLQMSPNSYLGPFCKGIHEQHSEDYVNSCESLTEAIKLNSKSGLLWFKLCLCQSFLYRFSEAEKSCLKALEFSKMNKKDIWTCKVKLLQALSEQEEKEKYMKAEKLGEELYEINPDDIEVLEGLIKTKIKLEKFSEADKYLNWLQNDKFKHQKEYLNCLKLMYMGKKEDCKSTLEKLVSLFHDHYEALLLLGKIYYDENDAKHCFSCLLKSTKFNPWCFLNFLYLGHCYRTMLNDFEKARRCYQKAFQLNPTSAEVGINLSDLYRILGREDLNMELLSTVTFLNPRSKWAWLKLGLHYLSTNQHQDAVDCLRIAVRLDGNDKSAWECLGDAYFFHGAYTSALKSYQRANELDSDSIFSMLQIAKVKHLINLLRESVEDFRLINKKVPNYVPALKGHSEACLALMKQYLSDNLNGLAADICQEAANSLIKCLQQQKDLLCIWKLLGDCCTLLSNLPEKYCKLKMISLVALNSKLESDEITLHKDKVLNLGVRCYCQAIAINSDLSSLWYDLAFIYNAMVKVSKTEGSKKQMRELALSAVKKSISINQDSWESWNLYGIILASNEIQNYRLAQHCFIKALLKNDKCAITWTNLGTLYLGLHDLQIANQSFTEAQKCDHEYVMCWVGQAIIAHHIGHHDAMDLFRHSTQLGFSTEGCLGYSDAVCKTLIGTKNKNDKNYLFSIKNMNAVTLATDLLVWYTDRIINNPWALNMLGLLLERQMLYKRSAEAFRQALDIVQSEKIPVGKEENHFKNLDKIILNYSRVLSNLQRYEEAIMHLKNIKEATFANHCELAAAYYRAKLYEEAYSSYEIALGWLTTETELKADILVAMAAVVYLHQGPEDAKILLMQSCQLKPPSVQGLLALCALGMLHSDLPLSELALKELDEFKDDVRYLNHIAVFKAYMYLFQFHKKKAIQALSKMLHRHPNQPSLWLSLSLLILNLYPTFDCRSAAKCAETALFSGRSSIDVSKVMSLVSLSNLLSGEGWKSLRSSQKAVHMFPDVPENWVVLVASVLSKCLVRQSNEEIFWLKKMITFIRRKFESSKPMTQWLSNNDRKITMMTNKLQGTKPIKCYSYNNGWKTITYSDARKNERVLTQVEDFKYLGSASNLTEAWAQIGQYLERSKQR